MTQYQGLDVLEIDADGSFARLDDHARGIEGIGADTGRREVDDVAGETGLVREYAWTGLGLADVAELKAFMDARRGRAIPFWLPSTLEDLTLNGDHLAAHLFIDIPTIGYASNLFPYTGARRHLFFRPIAGGASVYRKVINAMNNLIGTESLFLEAALGVDMPKSGWIVGFLRCCRLEDDELSINWRSRGYQTARIRVRELPLEAPL